MKAIRQYEYGPPETLRYEDVPDPEPGSGQVRVRVEACGVHTVDTFIRRGEGPPTIPSSLPSTPGREVAGTVDAVANDVDTDWIGTRVVAHLGPVAGGGYAEAAVVAAESLHRIPEHLSSAEAVTQVGTGRTAQWVLEAAAIREGDIVVVPGASGGLGNQLVQLAAALGARAVGLYGGDFKRSTLEGLDVVTVDSTDPDWPKLLDEGLEGVSPTVLLDGVGGPIGRTVVESLAVGGRVVIFGWSAGEATRLTTADIVGGGLSVTSLLGTPIADIRTLEDRALRAASDGVVRILVEEYPLAEAWRAHQAIEQRRSRGKVVLIP